MDKRIDIYTDGVTLKTRHPHDSVKVTSANGFTFPINFYQNDGYVDVRVKFLLSPTYTNDNGFHIKMGGIEGGWVYNLQNATDSYHYYKFATGYYRNKIGVSTGAMFDFTFYGDGKVTNNITNTAMIKGGDIVHTEASKAFQLSVANDTNILLIKVTDKDGNVLNDIKPLFGEDGSVALHDSVTDTTYTSDKFSKTTYTFSDWFFINKLDFGGMAVTFDGNTEDVHPWWSPMLEEVSNGTILNSMCDSLFSGDTSLSKFDCQLPNIDQANTMFEGCAISEFNTDISTVTDVGAMFYGCVNLTNMNLNIPNATKVKHLFYGCANLTDVALDLRSVTTTEELTSMFGECSKLRQAEIILPSSLADVNADTFEVPADAPCRAYIYTKSIGENVVKVMLTDTEHKIVYDGKLTDDATVTTINCADILRDVNDCFEGDALQKVQEYLSTYGYNDTQAYVAYVDARECTMASPSNKYRVEFIRRDSDYGCLLVVNCTIGMYYDTDIDGNLVQSPAYGYSHATIQGYDAIRRRLDYTKSSGIILPE